MAKKQEPTKPIFPLKHEFYASLDKYIHESGMLADCVRQCLSMPGIINNNAMRKILQERLDAYNAARDVEHG